MGRSFWEYKAPGGSAGRTMVHAFHDGILHTMACDQEGKILFHAIEETDSAENFHTIISQTGAVNGGRMLIENPIMFVPEPFENANAQDIMGEEVRRSVLGDGLVLMCGNCPLTPCFHVAHPLYMAAKEKANLHDHFVFTYVHDKNCIVLYFNKGSLELGNIFPVHNESEVLYFCAAPLKKAGIAVTQVRFELLADAEDAQRIMKTLDRFLPNARIARIELPYPAGEYPPFAAEAYLLHQFLTKCALPAAL